MSRELEIIWEEVKGFLSKELKGPSYSTWIRPTKLLEISDDKAIIGVKNEFHKNFLQQSYIEKITLALERRLKRKINVDIMVKEDLDIGEFIPSIATLGSQKSGARSQDSEVGIRTTTPLSGGFFDHTFRFKSNLNPSYTFETFIVGASNQFCHAACLAVAETKEGLYNPLFIYGGVGLGKTHLVHAVANYVTHQNKGFVKYTSSESFTNELIQSIRTDNMSKFREKYRQLDVLMIDDIQFLAGKEATQEEFFHTFNTLRENGKQIILTADRPPNLLSSVTDRLKSRFEGGLIADIQAPDLETRIAILLLKAANLGFDLKIDVAEYIATIFTNNIRELEGALKRVHAYLSFTQEEINLKNVQRVLSCSYNISTTKPTPEAILKIIASFYNITQEELISSKRSSHLTLPRHIAVYILHEFYKLSFPRIGEILSNRTHSSAVYAYKQVRKKLTKDPLLAEQVNSLRGVLERTKLVTA